MALNFDALTALTRKKYVPKLVDNIFKSSPMLSYLKDRQKSYDGGLGIIQPLIYGELAGIASYSGYDQIVYDTSIPITAAEYKPKNIVAPIIISKDEELTNQGENQVINLLEAKMQIAEETLKKQFTAQLYGDGTGNSGKDVDGLAAMIKDTNIYGGIDRTLYPWWAAIRKTNGGVKRTLTEVMMLQAYLACSDGDDTPEVIFTDVEGWTQYYLLVKGRITIYTDSVKKAQSLGFQTLEFMGKPVIMDRNMPAQAAGITRMYFLNPKYMNLRYHSAANFTPTKWRPDDTRIAKKQEILWTGNLTCSNSRRIGVLEDIDTVGIVG